MTKAYSGIAIAVFLLGLFPSVFLPTLKLILLIVLTGLFVSFRQLDRHVLRQLLSWRYLAFAQFCIFFFVNALIYPVWDNPKIHYRAIALESWSVSLVCLVALTLWLNIQKAEDIKRALIAWLPVGLTLSFIIATVFYLWTGQGTRVRIFSPSPLVPPFWFLVFTLASFAWFSEMSKVHKIWRVLLIFMAGVMIIFGGARLVMLAWILCSVLLAIWMYQQTSPKHRFRVLIGIGLSIFFCAGGVFVADLMSGKLLVGRMSVLSQGDLTYEALRERFFRFQIWSGSLAIISDSIWLGVGQANERAALSQEMGWERWLRAHQTYLSYLIAGGIPALISGVLIQSPVLIFLKRQNRSALFPAFLGLGVVVTLNCLTDSIFQSAVSVQVFMVATLLFLRASDADQPTLQPQKQVSSAAI